ncbi:Uncharacterized protein BM_BM18579 [Brugia malayi]|uniref:Uncharacterized protein n=1 Tax=Brugia malayi TaxID=6279 RepID=A0A4E9F5W6_BRUMA|nr:Uncharacterized protein BM_BM18579 [Brugia malayi]VIO90547.1 Uncharacterized protein BM_BM18579 [Brugia malayi]
MRNPRFALFTLFFCIFGTSILLVASQRSAPDDNDKIEDYHSYGEPDDIDDDDFDDDDFDMFSSFFTDIIFNRNHTTLTLTFLSTSQDTASSFAINILTQLMRDGHITDAVLPWNTGRPLLLRINQTTTG